MRPHFPKPPRRRPSRWRKRVLLLVLGLGLAAGAVLYFGRPPAPPPAPEPPPPVVERRGPALQADAEGNYLPGYRFTVERYRFTRFTLRPDPEVTFTLTTTGRESPAFCDEARIRPETFRVQCEHDRLGIVIIEGRFLARVATDRLGTPVVAAVVTVRTHGGETRYSAQDSFTWQPAE